MQRPVGAPFGTRSAIHAPRGMAATSQPLATQAAVHVLRSGGNAFDAALAANAVLALTEPTGCGLGGDLFLLAWSAAEERVVAYNGSGRSPRGLSAEAYAGAEDRRRGPLSVTVPGCVEAWTAIHERLGRKPLPELLAPAIEYAREGFPLSPVIASEWQRSVPVLSKYPGFAQQFAPDGRGPGAGEFFANPNLARTLEVIAADGRAGFYSGEVAERLILDANAAGCPLSRADLDEHRGEWIEPISTTYRGVEVLEVGPNTQGVAALQLLNLMELKPLREWGRESAETWHWFIEAKKLAFADRAAWSADPAASELPTSERISKAYAARRAEEIDPARAAGAYEPLAWPAGAGDTCYLCTADAEGNLVSWIQSNFIGMGSGLAPGDLGFVLQCRGALFDPRPGRPNSFAPGKRPFHTILPGLLLKDGRPWSAFGIMGGDTQPQAHAQIVANLVDFDLDLQGAGDAPRVVHSGLLQPDGGLDGSSAASDGGRVHLERGFAPELAEQLAARGHRVVEAPGVFGGYQAVARTARWSDPFPAGRRGWVGASEPRKDGQAAGY
ncbi:MAG: gamma-glutamyltransferase family protein [Planctomycetota bacterium]